VRELLPGIFVWPWYSERHGYDFNGTLVLHESGNICIDPVEPPDDLLETLANQGVARILLTNRNHALGQGAILVGDGVEILAGARERLAELVARFPPDSS
jgi:hypothetical protein